MAARLTRAFFYIGIALLFPANLFRIQHWVGGNYLLLAALVSEALFFLLVIVEIAISQYISVIQKLLVAILWGVPFLLTLILVHGLGAILVLILLGYCYLGLIRKKIVPIRDRFKDIGFDSI